MENAGPSQHPGNHHEAPRKSHPPPRATGAEATEIHTYILTTEGPDATSTHHKAASLAELLPRVHAATVARVRPNLTPGSGTVWVHCRLERSDHPHQRGKTRCPQRDDHQAPTCYYGKFQIDPQEPPCLSTEQHQWTPGEHQGPASHPLAKVTITNPCGGSIITDLCTKCGHRRETNTGATDPLDNSRDNRSLRYC